MKGIWLSIGLLALGAVPAAQAAPSSDCAATRGAVQRLICLHPALHAMERSLRALARASARGRRAARRDQQRWRSSRDDMLWRMMSNASFTETAVLRRAWQLARSRQAFLLARAGQGAMPSGPLVRMARVLHGHPRAGGDPLDTWVSHDPGVLQARLLHAVPGRLAAVLSRVELSPGARLLTRVEETDTGYPTLDLLWLPEARLGAVVSVQGTADCQLAVWFQADRAGVAHVVPSPMLDQAPCGNAKLTLLRVGYDTYIALERSEGSFAVDVSMQQWLDGRWASPRRLRLRYDHGLALGQLRCNDRSCTRYAALVRRIARRYDARPQGPRMMLDRLRPDERARARRLLRMAHADRKTALGTMPLAGDEPMITFCSDASFVLVRVDGRLLLGRIGHGYLGWRRSGGWRIGLWDVRAGTPVPVASAVIRRPRGRLLAMAAMPRMVIPTR
jgi:hypothetical protein